ncbi:MAG: glycosyl transferase family 2 [Chthoniobacterales bacterium]|nr:MAG: glycosyl transferase family 2 [Chthoniobacterales bacterium]
MVDAGEIRLCDSLGARERCRDSYWRMHDPILSDRLLWRANTFRHSVHLLPGQSILELGCGEGELTRALLHVTRGENPITSVTFQGQSCTVASPTVEWHKLGSFPGSLAGRAFDCIIAMDLLDRDSCAAFLSAIYELLVPGGEILFYESNPWNPVRKLRRFFLRLVGTCDSRNLIDRPGLCELLSASSFIRVNAVFNDFVFAPLTRPAVWLLRNLSILLENAPMVRAMAGSILVHAQKPPRTKLLPDVSLSSHHSLRKAVSVVVPCYNEEMNVRPLVSRILKLYGDYVYEIILLNDGSTDRTAKTIDELAAEDERVRVIHRQPPNGVGHALRDGLGRATGRYVFTMDCDFEHLLPEFRDLFDAIVDDSDVVVGSRFSRHSVLLNYPFLKIVANRAFHTLAAILFGRCLRDVTNNLKIMRREVVENLLLRQPGFAVNAEIGLQPFILGYRIKEVPISWVDRTTEMGSSSFNLLEEGGSYWRVLAGLWLKFAFNVGPYRDLHRKASDVDKPALVTAVR